MSQWESSAQLSWEPKGRVAVEVRVHVGVFEWTHGVGQEAAGRAARGELTV